MIGYEEQSIVSYIDYIIFMRVEDMNAFVVINLFKSKKEMLSMQVTNPHRYKNGD